MRTLFILISFLTSLTSKGQVESIQGDTTFKKVSREYYTINFPTSWSIDTSKNFGLDLILKSTKENDQDDFSENLNILYQNLGGLNYTLAKMGAESEGQVKKLVTDFEILESKVEDIGSLQFYTLNYKGKNGIYYLTIYQRYYLKNDIGFALTFTVESSKVNNFKQTADIIFDSFKLF